MAKGRKLTFAETILARTIFKESINYDAVKIYNSRYWAQFGNWVMTPNGNIYAPGTYEADYSVPSVRYGRRSLFIHELVHVWQYQNDVLSIAMGALAANIANFFQYADAYPYDLDTSSDLLDYTMERQAAIIEDYFRIKEGRSPIHKRRKPGTPRSKSAYEAVLKKFLANPEYAKGHMHRYDEETEEN